MTTQTQPEYGKLYGITHDRKTGAALIRTPRVLKVGIGIAKGKAVHVFLHNGDWMIRFGAWEKAGGKDKLVMKTVYRGNAETAPGVVMPNDRASVETWYHAHKHEAAVSNRPQKLPHFTFTRRAVIEDEGKTVEVFEPDFEAIDAHGDAPRRIAVFLTSDNPLHQELSMYSASELKCHGDGRLAERVISMGSVKDNNWKAAKEANQKTFIYEQCGQECQFYGKDCKPHSVLSLQLFHAMRLGATAYFTSTGMVSASQLFSSLTEISDAMHRRDLSICGIPVDLVLGSFRANHDGKPTAQPCVSLELRAAGKAALDTILAENAWVPMRLEPRMLEAPPLVDAAVVYDAPGQVLTDNPEFEEEEEPVPTAAAATSARTDELAKAIEQARTTAATEAEDVF